MRNIHVVITDVISSKCFMERNLINSKVISIFHNKCMDIIYEEVVIKFGLDIEKEVYNKDQRNIYGE